MKIVAISNPDMAEASWLTALHHGYITFIYHHADPAHLLSTNKFIYVSTDEELQEKINLVKLDHTVQEEILRW